MCHPPFLVISGCHPSSPVLLMGLEKPGDARPIAISGRWYRFAGVCALRTYGRGGSGARLGPLQVGVGTPGGTETVAHAPASALAEDIEMVVISVDMASAFHSISLAAMFAAVQQSAPALLPTVQWVYGEESPLRIVGYPEGTPPGMSQRGVRQGDPLGPRFLSALTLQHVMDQVHAACGQAPLVSYLDEMKIVGKLTLAAGVLGQLFKSQRKTACARSCFSHVNVNVNNCAPPVFGGRCGWCPSWSGVTPEFCLLFFVVVRLRPASLRADWMPSAHMNFRIRTGANPCTW